jgi:uncharacterized protein (TIGR02466 family)
MDKLLVNPLWKTPIWELQTDFDKEFNERLLNEIYSIGKNIQTGVDINPHDSLWSYNKPYLNQLKKTIINSVTKCVQEDIPEARELNITCESYMCWTNIREPGESLEIHAHTDSAIAVTYFIKCGENCGDLILFDTKDCISWETGQLTGNNIKRKRISPVEGKLVFFPSYVLHTVEENKSNDLRITITCDLKKVIDKTAPGAILLKSWASKMVKIKEWQNV